MGDLNMKIEYPPDALETIMMKKKLYEEENKLTWAEV